MIWWLVDNVNVIYFLLGLVALGCAVLFWQSKRGRDLLAIAVIVAIGVLVWFLASLVITDRKQIELNMHSLAMAALHHEPKQITALLAKDFQFAGMEKPQIGDYVASRAKAGGVDGYRISDFKVDNLSHDKDTNQGRAEASFRLRVDHPSGPSLFICPVIFVIEDGQWRLKSIKLGDPVTGKAFME